ncbi:MAG: hypothetical protein P8Y42_12835 [Exilibacterium sp.]
MMNKNQDSEFLQRVYGEDTAEPVDLPAGLHDKLYRIPRKSRQKSWIMMGAIAASLAFVMLAFSLLLEPLQQERDLLQAEKDLRIALQYLQKANDKANRSLQHTLNDSLQSATLKPIMHTVYSVSSSEGV